MSETYSIYFNANKEAFAYEIENPICVIDSDSWAQYAGTDKWDIINGEFIDISGTEEYISKKTKEEEDRVNTLTMTPLDFIKVLESFGITYQEIQTYLSEHQELDKQLKYCQNVYCGVVKQLLPLRVGNVEITKELVERAFKAKHGEE